MSAPKSGRPDLDGQTALVTGAGGGIGTAVAESLAVEGADVVAVDVDGASLDAVRDGVEDHGRTCETVHCDVTESADVHALREAALAAFDSVEIVVTAAGVTSPTLSIEEPMAEWHEVLATNLTGTFETCRAFFDHMVANEYGKIVTIGSIAGRTGRPQAGPSYAASKGGVHAVTRWLAVHGAEHAVYANAIAPGPIRTRMTEMGDTTTPDAQPLNRIGEPEDVAQAVVFLASQQSHWITGAVLDLNGGQVMR